MVTWERPLYKTDFIESYSLFYEHEYTSKPVKMLLSKHQFSYVIDTTKYPGTRFEVWMSSNGDRGTSSETSHVFAFSGTLLVSLYICVYFRVSKFFLS